VGGTVVAIEPAEWQDRWKDFAQPVAVGEALVIAPAWREIQLETDVVGATAKRADQHLERPAPLVIRIDPGPCFGSGTHPSSRLILGQLMDLASRGGLAGLRVLDVGCGSGILSVTAAALGAAVTAVDIDPDAVRYTESNAAANGVSDLVSATTGPVTDLGGGFDLALINVTAGVHAVVGPVTAAAVHAGATLFLAGLLPGQWRHVAGAYPGTTVGARPVLDGWEGVVLTKD
jgi:ribosomal protein L11 methyltransferase